MDDLKRNGEGYYDPTPYNAMKNFVGGGKKMNKGEIWMDDSGKYWVIIADHERFSTVLNLREERNNAEEVEVIARYVMYTNPAMVSYKFDNKLCEFVRTLNDAEFDLLMDKVAEELGLASTDGEYEEQIQERMSALEAENDDLRTQLKETKLKAQEMRNEILSLRSDIPKPQESSAELIRLETERDTYKRLYEQAIERMIGR